MNSTFLEIIHYTSVIAVEILAALVLAIIMFAMIIYREHRRSSLYLFLAIAVEFLFLLGDAASFYNLSISTLPLWLMNIAYFLSYTFGFLVVIPFALYSGKFIMEKTPVRRGVYQVPVVVSLVSVIIAIASILSGSVYGVVDGKMTEINGLPAITGLIQIFVALYLPIVAFTKVKKIGLKSVMILGLFGIVPVALYFISYNYAGAGTALSLIIVYVLLQCNTSQEKEAQRKELAILNEQLEENQVQLEEAAAEQEAQIEEIKALNSELEERQAQLEEASAEQEAQIEEVTALNEELEVNRRQLEKQIAVIGATSQRYFCAYAFDLKKNTFQEVFTLPNMREVLGFEGDALKPLELAWRHLVVPEDQEIMRNFHDITRWNEYLKDSDSYSVEYRGVTSGWSRATLYAGKRENGDVTGVIYTLEEIHEQKNTELTLASQLQEITTLNSELEERQAQMEELTVEQESQIEEIQTLNAQLIKARKEADSANAAKTSFLFNMSHDIRTPMNAIMGFRDLLEKHQEDPKKREDYLKKIEESSNVLLSIINNVLEMARIEKGTLEIDESAWSAEQFNDTLYSIFHELMLEKGISFTRQIDVKNPYVFCDPIKLREVFINILSNAYKYTNAGGSVFMHLKEIPSDREGYAMYQTTITDTGIGMSEEFIPHIFEEFSRENTSTDNKIEGTGLGMPIVRRLVEFMDGTIEVGSEKGVGSTFVVTIPHRIAERSSLVEHAGVEIDPKLFEGKRILLAEDNDLNAEIAVEILGEAGFIVERAVDGAVCCEKLSDAEGNYYDLILMDIQMPHMNGYEASRAIRQMQDSTKANIPILAMTANAFEEDKREAIRSGMNGHLAKPINVTELMKALAGILG